MKKNSQKNAERGAALVEFAIVLPLLLTLLVGIVEFGLLFYNQQVLTNASREGARAGISRSDKISTIVKDYCEARLVSFSTVPDVDTTVDGVVDPFPNYPDYPDDITVMVQYVYTFLVPELLGFGPSMQLSASTVMKMEREEAI